MCKRKLIKKIKKKKHWKLKTTRKSIKWKMEIRKHKRQASIILNLMNKVKSKVKEWKKWLKNHVITIYYVPGRNFFGCRLVDEVSLKREEKKCKMQFQPHIKIMKQHFYCYLFFQTVYRVKHYNRINLTL